MTDHVTSEPQTQAIPRVLTQVPAAREHEIAVSEAEAEAQAEAQAEVAQPESVQEMYEAGLLKLEALHDRWAAAMAKIRDPQVSGEPGEAAA